MKRALSSMPYLVAPALIGCFALFVALACGGGSSTTPVEEESRPLCYASHPVGDAGMVRNLRASEWADLIVRSYHEGQSSGEDCIGNDIEWHATDTACDVHEDEDERAPEPQEITEESVIVGRGDTAMRRPIWVITHRFEDGDGFGPVVVTDRNAEGVGVRAIGSLRMPVERARLRLRETGGRHIVVADGERCPDEDDDDDEPDQGDSAPGAEAPQDEEPTCQRYARILPMVGSELSTPELRNAIDNHCIGPAQVWLAREEKVALETGWERTFRLAASLEYRAGAIIVHEQVTMEDSDPRDPGRPARLFRTTDADRVILLERRGGMRSRGVPLFERALRAHGSTQLPIGASERSDEATPAQGAAR